jgi:Autographiviridae endonuclease VII
MTTAVALRRCSKCLQDKDPSEFWKGASRCKPCRKADYQDYRAANHERLLAYSKAYRQGHREQFSVWHRNYRVRTTYGLTVAEYRDLCERQDNRCGICRRDFAELGRRPSVDHDHDTGRVRGLLCDNCNRGLGFFKENPRFLDAAKEWLTK